MPSISRAFTCRWKADDPCDARRKRPVGDIPDAKDVNYCTRAEDGVSISSSLERAAEKEVTLCRGQGRWEVDLAEVGRIAK